MEIYIKLFEVLFPVFFVVGIGYYLGKTNPKIDTTFITSFAANIGTPAMVIYAITSTGINFEIFRDYFWYFTDIVFVILGLFRQFQATFGHFEKIRSMTEKCPKKNYSGGLRTPSWELLG